MKKYIVIIVVAVVAWVVYLKFGSSIKSTITNITS